MDLGLLVLIVTGLSLLVRGDGGCKVLDYFACGKNKTFTGRVIKSFRILAPGLEDCQPRCYLEDNCVSYNLGPDEGIARTCELNDADHVSDPDHLVSKKDFEYCPIKNPCSSSPCHSNEWCAPDFHWNTFKCSVGRWTHWSAWSLCYCPSTRTRKCVTPKKAYVNVCDGNSNDVKECEALTNIQGCSEPLGMQDGRIKDHQISASSEHSAYCAPSKGRLYKAPSLWYSLDGGWCTAQSRIGEYLQIDLGIMKWVTKIATQGRNIHSHYQWVTKYTLSFANNTNKWEDYRGDQNCTKHFIGNTDRNTVITRELPVPVKTRYVRIFPQSYVRYMSMRAELYGCTPV